MKLFKPQSEIVYYSQRNNWLWPNEACFPTSLAMALRNNRLAENLTRFCVDDILTMMANHESVGKVIARRVGVDPEYQRLNQWWGVMEGLAEWFLGGDSYRDAVVWREGASLQQIKKEIDAGYMVVIGTSLARLVGGSGHIVCVSGYDGENLILSDPFGDPNQRYKKGVSGHLVTAGESLRPYLEILGNGRYRALFIHSDGNPVA